MNNELTTRKVTFSKKAQDFLLSNACFIQEIKEVVSAYFSKRNPLSTRELVIDLQHNYLILDGFNMYPLAGEFVIKDFVGNILSIEKINQTNYQQIYVIVDNYVNCTELVEFGEFATIEEAKKAIMGKDVMIMGYSYNRTYKIFLDEYLTK